MPVKNILIADDEAPIREILIRSLKDKGYRFFSASNGEQAVEIAQKNPIDLAILDIRMPEMDGVEALKQIKALDENIEVLIMTGHADIGSLREIIFDYGARDYLSKPFDPNELKLAVRRALRYRELALKNSFVKKELENRILELERDFKEKTFRMRESQIKYRDIVENSTDAVVVIQDGYIRFANSTAMELTGYSREEILNIPFVEVLHPDDSAGATERYNKRLKGGDIPRISTFRVVRKDGSFFWVENNAVKTMWGERPAVLNVIRDISERIDLQDALGMQTHRLNERVKELSCLFGISELVQKPNVSEEEIYREAVNLIFQAVRYPEIACARIILEDQEFKTDNFRETPWKLIEHINVDDKHTGILEVGYLEETPDSHQEPFQNEERRLVRAVAERIGKISDRIRIRKAMRIKDDALASSISGIGLTDLEGNLTYVNKALLEMWGYSDDDEVIGKSVQTFTHHETEAVEVIKELREEGFYVGEITGVSKDGALFKALVSASIVTDESNNPICMMGSFIDITEQKKTEEFMMRSEKLSSLGQLSAGLAHELRNPLAVISSCSQFCLENMKLERLVKENFQVIYRNSQRASNLIGELLTFARPDRLERKEVDINEVVTMMLRMAELEVNISHITFVRRLRRNLPKIIGDEEKLGQVLLNLIQNAIQAVSGTGEIVIETRFPVSDDMLEVNIIDDGPGIPKDYREKVFDPFFTTKDGGTGLGLSICHSIVEKHQGDINIECGEEVGTKVSVRLPVKQEER